MDGYLLWGFGLLAIALLLIVVDIFIPTFGVLAITSLVVGIAGVVCLYYYSTTWGLIGTLLLVVGGPSVLFFGLQVMPSTPIGRRLVLGAEDVDAAEAKRRGEAAAAVNELARLVGAEGTVISDLRPIGMVRIGDQRYEALSDSTLVRAGEMVKVIGNDGLTLKVRPVA